MYLYLWTALGAMEESSLLFCIGYDLSHRVYIMTASSSHTLSALLNRSKLVYGPIIGQSNMSVLYTQFLPKPAKKDSNVPKLKSS